MERRGECGRLLALAGRGGWPEACLAAAAADAEGAFELALLDRRLEQVERFLEGGAQSVIGGLGEDIRSGGDEVHTHLERRTGGGVMFDDDAGFIDLKRSAQFIEMPFNQKVQRGGGLVMEMFEREFHWRGEDGAHCGRWLRIRVLRRIT